MNSNNDSASDVNPSPTLELEPAPHIHFEGTIESIKLDEIDISGEGKLATLPQDYATVKITKIIEVYNTNQIINESESYIMLFKNSLRQIMFYEVVPEPVKTNKPDATVSKQFYPKEYLYEGDIISVKEVAPGKQLEMTSELIGLNVGDSFRARIYPDMIENTQGYPEVNSYEIIR